MSEPITGGCLCGAIRYEVSVPVEKLIACHCTDCGSPIYSQRANAPDFLVLKAGSLDHPEGLKVVMNIWTRSRRPWTLMDESLESHEGNRPVK